MKRLRGLGWSHRWTNRKHVLEAGEEHRQEDRVINVWKTIAVSCKIKTKKRCMFPNIRGS